MLLLLRRWSFRKLPLRGDSCQRVTNHLSVSFYRADDMGVLTVQDCKFHSRLILGMRPRGSSRSILTRFRWTRLALQRLFRLNPCTKRMIFHTRYFASPLSTRFVYTCETHKSEPLYSIDQHSHCLAPYHHSHQSC